MPLFPSLMHLSMFPTTPQRGGDYTRELDLFENLGLIPYPWVTNLCQKTPVCLFVLRLNVPINNFSVLLGSKVSGSRTQHGGGRFPTPDLSLRSPTLYHWATALHKKKKNPGLALKFTLKILLEFSIQGMYLMFRPCVKVFYQIPGRSYCFVGLIPTVSPPPPLWGKTLTVTRYYSTSSKATETKMFTTTTACIL